MKHKHTRIDDEYAVIASGKRFIAEWAGINPETKASTIVRGEGRTPADAIRDCALGRMALGMLTREQAEEQIENALNDALGG